VISLPNLGRIGVLEVDAYRIMYLFEVDMIAIERLDLYI
jgi:hypothetical protein